MENFFVKRTHTSPMRFVRFFYFLIFIQAFFLQSCATSSTNNFEHGAKFKEDTQELGIAPITFIKKDFIKGASVEKINANELLVAGGFLDDLRKTTDPEIRAQKIKSMIVNVARIKFDGEEGAIKVKRQLFEVLGFSWDENFLREVGKKYKTMKIPIDMSESHKLIYSMYDDNFSIISLGGRGKEYFLVEDEGFVAFLETEMHGIKCGNPRATILYGIDVMYCGRMSSDHRYGFGFQYLVPLHGEYSVNKINFIFYEGK